MIRLGLADDEPLHIMGLATLLGAQPDMEIIWRAADGKEALARNAADPADVLLLDVQMPGLSGPATTRELMARGATGRVVILTTSDTDAPVMDAIEAGASGLLLTSTPPQELAAAIRTVHDGSSVISPGPRAGCSPPRALVTSGVHGPGRGPDATPPRTQSRRFGPPRPPSRLRA